MIKKAYIYRCFCFFFGVGQVLYGTHFSYNYATEVIHGSEEGFELLPAIQHFAKKQYRYLALSPLSDEGFVHNVKKARKFHMMSKQDQREVGHIFEVTTRDGAVIEGTFFDRKSDVLLVVGGGFTATREMRSSLLPMFLDYDVVLFDFRGHGYKQFSFVDPASWAVSLSSLLLNIDVKKCGLCSLEEEDVLAVVSAFKQHKTYNKVFGIAGCYGAGIFLKSQSLFPGLFDKLVLDSSWVSTRMLMESYQRDPGFILVDHNHGGLEDTWPWNTTWMKEIATWLAFNVFGFFEPGVNLLDLVPNIRDTSLLFFYSKKDRVVLRDQFEKLWHALSSSCQKSLVITSNSHSLSHVQQKEVFCLLTNLFFELPYDAFIACTRDFGNMIAHYEQKLRS